MSKYADLAVLHSMALQNVAGLSFEEFRQRNREYHAHRQMCIGKYGYEESVHAEYHGVSRTAVEEEQALREHEPATDPSEGEG